MVSRAAGKVYASTITAWTHKRDLAAPGTRGEDPASLDAPHTRLPSHSRALRARPNSS